MYRHINSKNPLLLNYFLTLHLQKFTNVLIAESLHAYGTTLLEESNMLAACCSVFIIVWFLNDILLSVVIIYNKCLMCNGHRLGRQVGKLTCEYS